MTTKTFTPIKQIVQKCQQAIKFPLKFYDVESSRLLFAVSVSDPSKSPSYVSKSFGVCFSRRPSWKSNWCYVWLKGVDETNVSAWIMFLDNLIVSFVLLRVISYAYLNERDVSLDIIKLWGCFHHLCVYLLNIYMGYVCNFILDTVRQIIQLYNLIINNLFVIWIGL